MKNVASYPEHQGNPKNIQFLSSEEHLAAHGGCFQNSTNGMFDPITGATLDFGQALKPCEAIPLSSPVIAIANEPQNLDAKGSTKPKQETDKTSSGASQARCSTAAPSGSEEGEKTVSKHLPGMKLSEMRARLAGIRASIKQFASGAAELAVDNKDTIKFVARDVVLPAIVTVGIGYITKSVSNGVDGHSRSASRISSGIVGSDSLSSLVSDALDNDVVKAGRASPREHLVSGYIRTMNGKRISVKPYTRGGKS